MPRTRRRLHASSPRGDGVDDIDRERSLPKTNIRLFDSDTEAREYYLPYFELELRIASSPYFQAMFSTGLVEEEMDRIEIHYIQPNILTAIIDFIYTGEIVLGQENVQELMVAGDMLEMKEVVHGCTSFLRNELHVSNAVGIYRFAEDHNCTDLAKIATTFIENHFPVIVGEEEFSEIPKNPLIKFLDSELLKVDSEYQVFQAVMKWINCDLPSRKRYVFELLSHVRLPLYHPRSNGLAERAVRTFKQRFASSKREGEDSHTRLCRFLMSYRAAVHRTTGRTPAELMMGRQLRTKLALLKPDLASRVEENVFRQKQYHDRGVVAVKEFEEGDTVWVKRKREETTFKEGVVKERTGPLSYVVIVEGVERRVHADQIRKAEEHQT